jgi:hypothetical protein
VQEAIIPRAAGEAVPTDGTSKMFKKGSVDTLIYFLVLRKKYQTLYVKESDQNC